MGNPVCLWQTELFKLNLKSSPSSSGYNRRRRLATRSSGKQQAERTAVRAASIVCPEESPPACIGRRQLCHKKIPLVGIDAPTPARGKGLQPYGALTLFFRWRKKSVQKKASGTATPGKRLLLPILTAGLAMSRAAELASLRLPSCALGARLFPPSKWAGLFPSAAYRRSAPPQSAAGKRTPCGLGCFVVAGRFCSVDKWTDFLFPAVGGGHTYPLQGGMLQCSLYIFATQKASVKSKSRWPV